jgi:hypothetical protein
MAEEPADDEYDRALMRPQAQRAARLIMLFPHVTNDLRAGLLFHYRVCIGHVLLDPYHGYCIPCFRFMRELIDLFVHYCKTNEPSRVVDATELGSDKSPEVFVRLATVTQPTALREYVSRMYDLTMRTQCMTRTACGDVGYWWIAAELLR